MLFPARPPPPEGLPAKHAIGTNNPAPLLPRHVTTPPEKVKKPKTESPALLQQHFCLFVKAKQVRLDASRVDGARGLEVARAHPQVERRAGQGRPRSGGRWGGDGPKCLRAGERGESESAPPPPLRPPLVPAPFRLALGSSRRGKLDPTRSGLLPATLARRAPGSAEPTRASGRWPRRRRRRR